MLIPRKSGRMAALAVASALAACNTPAGPDLGPCDPFVKQLGCVDLVNAHGGYIEINGVTVPPQNILPDGGIVGPPGHSGGIVTNTSAGSTNTFTARVSGADAGMVTCTVGAYSWADVNPSVVLQPANYGLTCGVW